ncbi:hypothetical protein CORC01_06233 [Colletotrichum orchidophilum]|uniref:Uncharacterized protein n=1 Tax=Colletotrichum orchidophilum TaxID=1209926 RepID=A0A1G4BAW7_9PEZI|nr:uncharacterized protein CORC01_06233 [Colletotrichum orchidophilum]OHE98442.1 hypothetical protein CORC01_06233 [Colletotrichum orchidophilum]
MKAGATERVRLAAVADGGGAGNFATFFGAFLPLPRGDWSRFAFLPVKGRPSATSDGDQLRTNSMYLVAASALSVTSSDPFSAFGQEASSVPHVQRWSSGVVRVLNRTTEIPVAEIHYC